MLSVQCAHGSAGPSSHMVCYIVEQYFAGLTPQPSDSVGADHLPEMAFNSTRLDDQMSGAAALPV